jgi:hypothetical protein
MHIIYMLHCFCSPLLFIKHGLTVIKNKYMHHKVCKTKMHAA